MKERLPLNCVVDYIPEFLTTASANELFKELVEEYDIPNLIPYIEGTSYVPNYGKLMFVDEDLKQQNKFPETIWGRTFLWSSSARSLKNRLEEMTHKEYHVGVCIYYPDGNSGVDFHSDDISYGDTSVLPSLSLGEERVFQLKEKATDLIYDKLLEHGSLLIMGEGCQELYYHALPTNPKYANARINITFRSYDAQIHR